MAIRNWNYDVTLTKAEGRQMYKTKDLIKKFQELKKDGYTGVSLGLIIDLIDDQVPQMEFGNLEK